MAAGKSGPQFTIRQTRMGVKGKKVEGKKGCASSWPPEPNLRQKEWPRQKGGKRMASKGTVKKKNKEALNWANSEGIQRTFRTNRGSCTL